MELYKKGRAWIEVSLGALGRNVLNIQQTLGTTNVFMAVVKADAYGLGAVEISKYMNSININTFAVATLEEAMLLRKNRVKGDILILGYTYPENFWLLKKYNLIQSIVDYNYALLLAAYGRKIRTHIKVDTGMNRMGIPYNKKEDLLNIFNLKNLCVEGVFTHLCVADSRRENDINYSLMQVDRFNQVIDYLHMHGNYPYIHINSSYGYLNGYHCSTNENFTRIGIAMYGVNDSKSMLKGLPFELTPVFSLKARVSTIKYLICGESVGYGRRYIAKSDRVIAGVTIGYADGIPRNVKEGKVLVNGRRAHIIGGICMDQLMIDITDIPGVSVGDIVTLIGEDAFGEKISILEFSEWTETIPNEILSRIGQRVNRIYCRDN